MEQHEQRLDREREHFRAVERVIRALGQPGGAALSLDEMARLAGMSPFHFHRIFQRTVGVAPGAFQAALRLEQAKRLLLTTPLSVTQVCYEVGYHSLGSFSTRFARHVGLAPARFRQLAASAVLPDHAHLRALGLGTPPPAPGGVAGRIHLPDHAALIFVGVYPMPIPLGRPVGCALLLSPGPFRVAPLPDGRYHVLAAAFPPLREPRLLLLPDARLRVGVARRPFMVRDGIADRPVELRLRPQRPTDPPIVAALPLLLVDGLAQRGGVKSPSDPGNLRKLQEARPG